MSRWPLAPLLVLRARAEACAAEHLARSLVRAQMAAIELASRERALRSGSWEPAGAISALGLGAVSRLSRRLHAELAAARAAAEEARATLDAARRAYVAARLERERLERGRERWERACRRLREAAQEREIDDAKYARQA